MKTVKTDLGDQLPKRDPFAIELMHAEIPVRSDSVQLHVIAELSKAKVADPTRTAGVLAQLSAVHRLLFFQTPPNKDVRLVAPPCCA